MIPSRPWLRRERTPGRSWRPVARVAALVAAIGASALLVVSAWPFVPTLPSIRGEVAAPTPASRPVGMKPPGSQAAELQAAGGQLQPAPVEPRHMPGQAVVLLRDRATMPAYRAELEARGVHVLGAIPELGALQVAVPIGREREALAELSADPRVEQAELNGVGRSFLVPDDAIYRDLQWSLRKIGMETAWEATTGSSDVIVAVLDTGVERDHPDLLGSVLAGYDFVNDDPDPSDDSSHGTFVAGVIAAQGNNAEGIAGIAWRTRILPVKVLDSEGLGADTVVSKGIIYAVENKAKIINLSSGATESSRLLEEAVRFAERRGVLVVTSAGNTGDKKNEVIYPAAYPSVLAIAATDERDDIPAFSQRQSYVAMAAPGVNIPGPAWRGGGRGDYLMHTGTSAAAPHVSGVAALILALKPEISLAELRSTLTETADRVPSRDGGAGAGRLNASRAIDKLRPAVAAARPPAAKPTATLPVVAAKPAIVLPTLRTLPPPGPLPVAPSTWYFAEGNTTPGYNTWLVLQNPLDRTTRATITFITQDGAVAAQTLEVGPNSRRSVLANDVVPNALVSFRVEADSTLFAERTVTFGHDAIGGIGTTSPSQTWYLAEGSTQPPFDTWIVLLNPNREPALAHLIFMMENGEVVEVDQPLPPQTRVSFDANDVLPTAGFATAVTSDLPIVVERSMYFSDGGGHGTIGVKTPGKTWFLAEGDTRKGFDTWILMQNPNATVANVAVTFIRETGEPVVAYYALDGQTRLSLHADQVVSNARFGARIESDQAIVVERSVYVVDGAGGHNSVAVPIPSTEWYLPEGSTQSPYQESLALLNPNADPVQADVTFMQADGTPPQTSTFLLRPRSRLTIDVGAIVPDAEVSTRVIADKPIVVERSMYFGRGATNSPGLQR